MERVLPASCTLPGVLVHSRFTIDWIKCKAARSLGRLQVKETGVRRSFVSTAQNATPVPLETRTLLKVMHHGKGEVSNVTYMSAHSAASQYWMLSYLWIGELKSAIPSYEISSIAPHPAMSLFLNKTMLSANCGARPRNDGSCFQAPWSALATANAKTAFLQTRCWYNASWIAFDYAATSLGFRCYYTRRELLLLSKEPVYSRPFSYSPQEDNL